MANNELSGPVLLNAIMLYIKKKYPKSKYSYRFVLLPETIGSIAYLSKFYKIMKSNIFCGFNLSCVGDEKAYSYQSSRKGNTIADEALLASLINLPNVIKYSFVLRGSDERQYCAPGIDLPVCGFSRSKKYPENHTNKDDFNLVTNKGLTESFEVIKRIIDVLEFGIYPKSKILGEPNLGRRGLYSSISQKNEAEFPNKNYLYDDSRVRTNLIAFSDGITNFFKIATLLKVPLDKLLKEYDVLRKAKILE